MILLKIYEGLFRSFTNKSSYFTSLPPKRKEKIPFSSSSSAPPPPYQSHFQSNQIHHHHHHHHREAKQSKAKMKKKKQQQKSMDGDDDEFNNNNNPFDLLTEEILFMILDCLHEYHHHPIDNKSFSLVCKSFYNAESRHRKTLKPLRSELLNTVLHRYPFVAHLDLTLCPRITDNTLSIISTSSSSSTLRSIDLSRSKFFSHVGLSTLVRNCSSLVEIDLSNATELTDSAAAVIREAKNLEKLSLSRCKLISDMGIGCIAVECRKLKSINLKWCLGITDLGVGLIAVKCNQLRTLDLSCVPITNKCLPSILRLPYLKDLVLVGCLGIIDYQGLATLKQESTTLETLNMSNCENLSPDGLSSITNGARCLRQLIISYGPPVTHALADSLQKLPMLQSLKLEGCQVSCSALKAIGNCCVSLKELSLSKCLGVSDEGLSFLVKKHKELEKLDVTCCREITNVSIDSVTTSCPSLISLRMESCNLVSEEAFISIGQRCHFLEELDFTESEINNEGLKSISRCSRLSILRIGICLNITDEGLIHIGLCCPKLIELDLYRCGGITDLGIAAIAGGCPKLETINIAYSKDITDNSLRLLSKCSRLNTLEIRGCPCISSIGLSFVAMRCKQLTKLDIKNCNNIDDAGMLSLAHFSQNLRQINLSYCSVTDIGVIALASICCLQNVTILHVDGLTPNGLAAALLACRGLTKAKLHISFKSKLSQAFLEHIESHGCAFQWRDKPFQVAIDARSWKRQLEDTL